MNAKTIVLCVLFLLFGFIAKAENFPSISRNSTNAEIPGGIVYSDGKDAIYYDFGTRENRNLTSDLNKAEVKSIFAVSDNGKVLIWEQNSKFWVRELPILTPYAVQVNELIYKRKGKKSFKSVPEDNRKIDIIWQGSDIKNLSLSPDGSRFAFDTIFQEPGWFSTGKSVYGQAGKEKVPFPFYAKRMDSYNGIFYLSTIYNKKSAPVNNPLAGISGKPAIQFFRPRYGNVVENPPVPFFKASKQDLPGSGHPGAFDISGRGGEITPEEMICYKKTIKKSAHYLTFQNIQNWENGQKLAAFIYKIGDQWGPIEIRVLDSRIQGGTGDEIRQGQTSYFNSKSRKPPKHIRKPREWELLFFPKTCDGLSWKPDGSLVVQGGGYVYSISASQIQAGINRSKVKIKRNKKTMIKFLPFNNVFTAKPELVAQGINGTCISWVSNDSFLFLDKDMAVCLWSNGKKENIVSFPISSKFYYCSKSPFVDLPNGFTLTSNNLADRTVSNRTSTIPSIYGRSRAPESTFGSRDYGTNCFSVGPVQDIKWWSRDTNSIFINAIGNHKNKWWKFAFPEETDINKIEDPSIYDYLSRDEHTGFSSEKIAITLPLNEVIIFKLGNDYVALRPLALNSRYRSIDNAPEYVQKRWERYWKKQDVETIPEYESMIYEWRFWPSVRKPKKVAKTKTWKKSLASKGWEITETPVLEEFYIDNIRFSWQPVQKKQHYPKAENMKLGKTYYPGKEYLLRHQVQTKTGYIGHFFTIANEPIKDPSIYNFLKNNLQIEGKLFLGWGWLQGKNNSVLVLKIDDRYIAIKPLHNKGGSITYTWKYWPEVIPDKKDKKGETKDNKGVRTIKVSGTFSNNNPDLLPVDEYGERQKQCGVSAC